LRRESEESKADFIRIAEPGDAERLVEVYAPYVRETAITFEYEVPSVETFRGRMEKILEKYPYLVAERDGRIVGYAYAGIFNERPAADWSVETAIYVERGNRRTGVGRELYKALEQALSRQNIINLNACIACPEAEDKYLTYNSIRFHEHMGYHMVGRFYKCGYKFGRWYHLAWMEKHLREHPAKPEPVIWFAQ